MGAWGGEWSGVGWDRRIQYDTANCTWLATAVHSTVCALRTARCWWCCTQAKKKRKAGETDRERRDEMRDEMTRNRRATARQDRTGSPRKQLQPTLR